MLFWLEGPEWLCNYLICPLFRATLQPKVTSCVSSVTACPFDMYRVAFVFLSNAFWLWFKYINIYIYIHLDFFPTIFFFFLLFEHVLVLVHSPCSVLAPRLCMVPCVSLDVFVKRDVLFFSSKDVTEIKLAY